MFDDFIRQSTRQDIGIVTSFIDQATLLHRHLDWWPLMDWIDQVPFLLLFSDEKLKAILSCAPDPPGVAWIHCFGVDKSFSYRTHWNALLSLALQDQAIKTSIVCAVGLHQWFIDLLVDSGFSLLQNIVVLAWNEQHPRELPIPSGVTIRPMLPGDIDQVTAIDSKAFEPIWVLSRETLEQSYSQAEHVSVAEIDEKIIGYEISTSNHFSAHLARLAVDPDHLHGNIGYSLINEMLSYFSRRGIRKITVNTQDNNVASISLYNKTGFNLTGESFPVYSLKT